MLEIEVTAADGLELDTICENCGKLFDHHHTTASGGDRFFFCSNECLDEYCSKGNIH